MATKWVSLPVAWSNKREVERLDPRAYGALSRAMLRAVAETGSTFSVWDAGRTKAEQIALFKRNYTPAGRGRKLSTDRAYAGQIWKRKSGGVSVASPDLGSNHEDGMAVDIHPGAIQNWLKANGSRFGISWDEGRRVGESWHYRVIPSQDQYTSEGIPDVKGLQKKLGVTVDDKFGPGTSGAVRKWQAANGLTADGIPGPKTMAAMGLGKGSAAPSKPASTPKPSTAAESYKLDRSPSPNCYADRKGHSVKHVTLHHWGTPTGQKRDGIISWLVNPEANVSAHYVVTKGHVTQLVEESCGSWANGNKTANLESITIECDPNDPAGTAPTVAALISDIRSRHGDIPIYPHQHWVATECPGAYLDLLPAIDAMARGGSANLGRPVVTKPKPQNVTVDGRLGTNTVKALQRYLVKFHKAKIVIDGRAGGNTWKALQRALGTPVDGIVSRQSYKASELGNGITQGWDYDGRGSKGSTMVRKLQSWVGVKQDGVWGEKTTAALQRKLNTYDLG